MIEGERETARVEAFSDGVFAIAATLLILEIQAPHLAEGAGNGDLLRALAGEWPSLLAFLLSFTAILIMWINHHGLFKLVRGVDRPFLYANGLLLLLVTFIPFPAAVLAGHLDKPSANAAAGFYCGSYLLISLAYNLLWESAVRGRLVRPGVPEGHVEKIRRAYRYGFPIYLGAALLAFVVPFAGLAVNLGLWLLWARLDYRPKPAPAG